MLIQMLYNIWNSSIVRGLKIVTVRHCKNCPKWRYGKKISSAKHRVCLGLIHTRHFCIQYCDKKYFAIKYILGHGSLKAKVSSLKKSRYVFQSFPWLVIETCGSKLSFYRIVAILCAKMSRVNKTFLWLVCDVFY